YRDLHSFPTRRSSDLHYRCWRLGLMAVGAQLRIGNGSEISPLRKLMAAAVVFLAADFFLLINFMASEVNRVSARGREGRGFYFIPIALAAYYACTWVLVARRRPEREPIVEIGRAHV